MAKPRAITSGIGYVLRPDDRLIDEHEAAAQLGLSVLTLRRWRWARKGLPFVKIGAAVRYLPNDISAAIEAGRRSPATDRNEATP